MVKSSPTTTRPKNRTAIPHPAPPHPDEQYINRIIVFARPCCVASRRRRLVSRGLDVPDLVCVINYSCPNHLEDYVHRVGRTGRAGRKGTAYTFISAEEEKHAPTLIKALTQSKQKVSSLPLPCSPPCCSVSLGSLSRLPSVCILSWFGSKYDCGVGANCRVGVGKGKERGAENGSRVESC